MLKLHPEILVKDGKKQFAVLPYEEFFSTPKYRICWSAGRTS